MARLDMLSMFPNSMALCNDLSAKDYHSNAVKEWEAYCPQSEKFPLC